MDRNSQRVASALLLLVMMLSACVAPPLNLPAAETLSQPKTASLLPTVTPESALTPQQQLLASLPSRGEAPELFNETWINSDPLKLADLRGKVVLIKFWTFG